MCKKRREPSEAREAEQVNRCENPPFRNHSIRWNRSTHGNRSIFVSGVTPVSVYFDGRCQNTFYSKGRAGNRGRSRPVLNAAVEFGTPAVDKFWADGGCECDTDDFLCWECIE